MFGTNDPINTYIDLTLSSAISSRKIRLDSASTALSGSNSILMGGSDMTTPSFAVGDYYCAVRNKLMVGDYGYPTGNVVFYCSGHSRFFI